jgi:cyclopropane-fatty-acyl-phospholipid synthase
MEHAWRRNSRRGSVRNIREHYDLSNEFYGLMLDETRCYSCGLFENEQTTLSAASVAKMDRLCRQLDLQPDDHLLEIGTGWGGLAMHAARRYGCRVTTTTISAAQYEYAQARVAEAGLGDRITLLRADYRDLTGQYDKLISVEMIEAVGHEYFGTFFEKCRQLARPGALLALQAILIRDDRYEQHLQSVDFIRRHVFPGGCLPSKQVLQQISQRLGWTWQAESDITAHYVPTLQAWRRNFWNAIDTVRAMGFTERFIRLWHYYLCYCEAGFAERQTLTAQFVLSLSAGGTAGMNLGQLVSASS